MSETVHRRSDYNGGPATGQASGSTRRSRRGCDPAGQTPLL